MFEGIQFVFGLGRVLGTADPGVHEWQRKISG